MATRLEGLGDSEGVGIQTFKTSMESKVTNDGQLGLTGMSNWMALGAQGDKSTTNSHQP